MKKSGLGAWRKCIVRYCSIAIDYNDALSIAIEVLIYNEESHFQMIV